jgi:hypothetical protein
MDFIGNSGTLKPITMERQNNRNPRERDNQQRESRNNEDRYPKNERASRYNQERPREDVSHLNGFNRHRLNDLYERSSI